MYDGSPGQSVLTEGAGPAGTPSAFTDGPGAPSYKNAFFRGAKDDYQRPPTSKTINLTLTRVTHPQ